MEELTIDLELTTHIGIQTFVTIGSISDNRMTDMCHMYTDLMCTARLDTTLEEGGSYIILNYFEVCHGTLSSLIYSYFGFISCVSYP